jgi:hypothetical protein
MFNGMHLGLPTGNGRRQARVGDTQRIDVNVHRLGQVDSAKHDARVHRRGPERQLNPLAAVQTHTHRLGEGFDGSLCKHGLILIFQDQACIKRVFKPTEFESQSACLRKKAGISMSSIPADAMPSTLAAACVRLVRHTLGVFKRP